VSICDAEGATTYRTFFPKVFGKYLLVQENVTVFSFSANAPVSEASYRLIDFFTLELLLLGGLVLLAFVLIALKSNSR
jgi:hypothetical protein